MRNSTIAISMCKCLAFFALLLVTATSSNAQTVSESFPPSPDEVLLRGVLENSLPMVEQAITAGGNPNRIFGVHDDEWTMCAAAMRNNAEILSALIAAGGDPNLHHAEATMNTEYPLICSMLGRGHVAFDLLIKAGADPSMSVCADCPPRMTRSILIEALSLSHYSIAKKVFDITKPTAEQIPTIVFIIERFHFAPDSDAARFTYELVDWLAEQGVTAVPPYPRE